MVPLVVLFGLLTHVIQSSEAAQCACATTNVNVRSGRGTSYTVLTVLLKNQCLPYKGSIYRNWANVDYSGDNAWIYAKYVRIGACASSSTETECPRIISRSEWGARARESNSELSVPVEYAFIHHGTGNSCSTQSSCSAVVRSYQNYHMDTKGWSDIGYSFLVGEDGNAYEGRGWDTVGAHTHGYNSVGLGFCMIGDFTSRVPNAVAMATLERLIACGVSKGKIQQNYTLRGHRDMKRTKCPGDALYNVIRTWPHY